MFSILKIHRDMNFLSISNTLLKLSRAQAARWDDRGKWYINYYVLLRDQVDRSDNRGK